MKPQRFEIGQVVTPNEKGWVDLNNNGPCPVKFGKIYHVSGYRAWCKLYKTWAMLLEEVPFSYDEVDFDPVISTSELESDLNKVTEPSFYELEKEYRNGC
jgi:hypothetical protein